MISIAAIKTFRNLRRLPVCLTDWVSPCGIFTKASRSNWQSELNKLSAGSDLVLLQEASRRASPMGDEWPVKLLGECVWNPAWRAKCRRTQPSDAFTDWSAPHEEPWLQLPGRPRALVALPTETMAKELAVINIHAINFTFGTEDYEAQLKSNWPVICNSIVRPVIFAGDFNSAGELALLYWRCVGGKVGLTEVAFEPR